MHTDVRTMLEHTHTHVCTHVLPQFVRLRKTAICGVCPALKGQEQAAALALERWRGTDAGQPGEYIPKP